MSAKIVKNSSYFSRFQTPFRRRRECKTDFVQRASLIQQDKTKYGAKKYRLVARITNTKVIAQIVAAEVDHDVTIAAATSKDLLAYGIELGLSNYAAAYCVGLLVARRLLKKLGLEEKFQGPPAEEEDDEEARRPFKAHLDVGLRRTTTGARVFAVLKGAVDGGLLIPHSAKRFAKGKGKDKTEQYYVLGGHVADYMKKLQGDEAAYKKQFGRYIAKGITADKIKGIYEAAHKKIRENPVAGEKPTEHYKPKVEKTKKLDPAERKKFITDWK